MRRLHCNHAWHSGFYTLATRCHTCTAVTLKYTEASSLTVLRHSWIQSLIPRFYEKKTMAFASDNNIALKGAFVIWHEWISGIKANDRNAVSEAPCVVMVTLKHRDQFMWPIWLTAFRTDRSPCSYRSSTGIGVSKEYREGKKFKLLYNHMCQVSHPQ